LSVYIESTRFHVVCNGFLLLFDSQSDRNIRLITKEYTKLDYGQIWYQ